MACLRGMTARADSNAAGREVNSVLTEHRQPVRRLESRNPLRSATIEL